MKKNIFLIVLLLSSFSFFGQSEVDDKKITSKKGTFFATWGWNRSSYTKSDIQFKGDNYNFTLTDVEAKDRQTTFGIRYFKLDELTLPQTNARLGYFFNDNWNVVLGLDHMKYVMQADQEVTIDGDINFGDYQIDSNTVNYDGNYNNDTIKLEENFIKFEHTDGLNYIFVGVNRFDNFNDFLHITNSNFELNLESGIDIAMLLPKTNATFLGEKRHDDFHAAGFGFSAKTAIDLTFYKHFFIQTEFKVGYINMSDIRTTSSASDTAKQHFSFFETAFMFGYRFKITK